jgi:hypothetical protein
MKSRVILSFTVILGFCLPVHPCTIFYATDGNIILVGNNEDWSDPDTRIWFIPPRGGKHGWIKFGFAGGFPQGGMNEHGLFWDATGCAYMAMPYSEANKEKYSGPLMNKVIEECSTIREALAVLDAYYCDDQYRAQYLIGDGTGASVIVEGDNIVEKSGNYQVLTNFYHSHPEIGGYPCWRYEIADSMLKHTDEISPYLFGSILSATHQEGSYPTQYSSICDLKNRIVYLFYYHNFEEFIELNLNEELNRGDRSYDLPSLFSKIQIISPKAGEQISTSDIVLKWKGKKSSRYDVFCSTDPDFSECAPCSAVNPHSSASHGMFAGILLTGFAVLSAIGIKDRRVVLPAAIIISMLLVNIGCGKGVTSPSLNSDVTEMSVTIENLESGKTYYWKVIAHPEQSDDFNSQSVIQNFTTTNPKK